MRVSRAYPQFAILPHPNPLPREREFCKGLQRGPGTAAVRPSLVAPEAAERYAASIISIARIPATPGALLTSVFPSVMSAKLFGGPEHSYAPASLGRSFE